MTKAIIFDCFGVLTQNKWSSILSGLDDDVRVKVRDLHRAFDRAFLSYEEFCSHLKELTDLTQKELDETFIYRTGYNKNDDLLAYIAELSKQYRVSVLSNVGTGWIRDKFLTPGEAALFTDMVLSYEVGLGKPDPEIYRLALRRLDIEPQEAVFVDDQLLYCDVAKSLGMNAIVYTNFAQFKHELETIL